MSRLQIGQFGASREASGGIRVCGCEPGPAMLAARAVIPGTANGPCVAVRFPAPDTEPVP